MTKLKIDFEFKQGDYVVLAGMSEEQAEAVTNKMVEDGCKFDEGVEWYDYSDGVLWYKDIGSVFTAYSYEQSVRLYDVTRKITLEDLFPEADNTENDDTDIENCKTSLEENIDMFNLQDPKTWQCFKEVADVLGEDQAEYELKKVLLVDLDTLLTEGCLSVAFEWSEAPQGYMFWKNVNNGTKPENYDTTPDVPPTPEADKPKLVIPDSVLEDIKVTFEDGLSETPEDEHLTVAYPSESNEQTIGSLIEDLYNKLPDSGVQIVMSGAGIYLTGLNMPTVDISKMETEVIDKTFEMFVECEGLWVLPEEGFEESEEN